LPEIHTKRRLSSTTYLHAAKVLGQGNGSEQDEIATC